MHRIKWGTLAGLIASSLIVSASVKANTASNEQWQEWRKVGSAQLTYFIFDVYKSQLLTPSGDYAQGKDVSPHPLALSIEYQRDISQKQLVDMEVQYQAEARLGERVVSQCIETQAGHYQHRLIKEEDEKELAFLATVWQ